MSELINYNDNTLQLLNYEELPKSEFVIAPELKEIMQKKIPYYIDSLAHNSQAAFKSDMGIFLSWCRENGYSAIPVEPTVLRRFVIEQAKEKAPSTIQRRLSTINKIHQILKLIKPAAEPEVVSAVKTIQENSDYEVRQAQPFREFNLSILGSIINKESLLDVRDLAIIALAHSTLLRRSEIAKVKTSHLDFDVTTGDATIEVRKIKSKKGDRSVHYAYLSPFATYWLKKWLELSGIEEGSLFRGLTKHETLRRRPLCGASIATSINRMGRLINDDFHFTGHSTRVGAAQDMVANGIETTKAMNAGRWKDHKTFMRYVAKLHAKENGMAELSRKKQSTAFG